ncbi:MAG: TIGR00266 family protein [Planctomycetota bacterium]
MKYKIDCQPGYSYLEVELDKGDSIASESGAMAWMDPAIEMETSTRGGVFSGLKRKILSGESFFQNTYTTAESGARLALAPGPAGAIVALELNGEEIFLQKGAYLASIGNISIDTKFDGLRGFFNEGLFVLRCSGTGTLFFNAYGDIQEVTVDGDYLVDNGFAVAWEPTLEYRLTKARRIRSFLFGDQILLRFSGRGKVWIQSRSPQGFASWVHPYRRKKAKNNNN